MDWRGSSVTFRRIRLNPWFLLKRHIKDDMKKVILPIFLAAISLSPVVAQQAATATLSGRVTDPNGAVIVGAKVIATQKATGAKRETVTNIEGMYALTNLSPGEYEVRIEARNFPQALVRRIELNVGQQSVFDGTLQASGPTETITLDDRFNYSLVNTSSAIIDGVVIDHEVERLPLNGRNYLAPSGERCRAPAPPFESIGLGLTVLGFAFACVLTSGLWP